MPIPVLSTRTNVPTFGVKATICTSSDVPDDVVYAVTKEVFENIEELKKLHPALAVLTKENMLQGNSAPLHPGALKYLQGSRSDQVICHYPGGRGYRALPLFASMRKGCSMDESTGRDAHNEEENFDEAHRLREEEELGLRRPQGFSRWLVPVIALCWSLFQLSLSSWLLLDSTKTRAIHLAFGFLIVFMSYPTLRRQVRIPGLRWLGEKTPDSASRPHSGRCACTGGNVHRHRLRRAGGAGRHARFSRPADRRLSCRYSSGGNTAGDRPGSAAGKIALFFTLYAFFGPYMPDFPRVQGGRPDRYVGQISP